MIRHHGRRAKGAGIVLGVVAVLFVIGVLLYALVPKSAPVAATSSSRTTAAADKPESPPSKSDNAVRAVEQLVTTDASTSAALEEVAAAPAPPPSANGGDAWTGRVVSKSTGVPIVGARVSQLDGELFSTLSEMPSKLVTVETDADGRFNLTTRPPKAAARRGVQLTMISAEADGYATLLVARPPVGIMGGVAREKSELLFELEDGEEISGRVVNEANVPIAGAFVGSAFLESPWGMGGQEMAPIPSGAATSDADGYFRITGLPKGRKLRLPARADGYLPMIVPETEIPSQNVLVVLKAGEASLKGKVVDSADQPVAGASVTVMATQGIDHSDFMQQFVRSQTTTSDAAGDFHFAALPAGQVHVIAMRGQVLAMGEVAEQRLSLNKGQEHEITLKFPSRMTISGQVIDVMTNQGVPGVRISTTPFPVGPWKNQQFDETSRVQATSGGDGTFVLRDTPATRGYMQIYYQAPAGYVLAEGMNGNEYMIHVQIPDPSSPQKLELRLKKGVALRGTVYEADGTTPVVEAAVSLQRRDVWSGGSTVSQTNGSFVLYVGNGERVRVTAAKDKASAHEEVDIPAQGEPEPIKLVMAKNGNISGTVTDENGKPVKGIPISVQVSYFNGRMSTTANDASRSRTDENGYYFIENVPPGEVTVAVNFDAYRWSGSAKPEEKELMAKYSPPPGVPLTVESGEVHEGIDFVLVEGLVVEGVVKDEEGNPIAGASIYPQINVDPMSHQRQTQTDAEGKFTIGGMMEDTIINYLNVSHQDYDSIHKQNITVASSPVEIVLKRKGKMTLVVESKSGSPAQIFEYRLLQNWNQGMMVQHWNHPPQRVESSEGRAVLEKVAAGKYRVEVRELSAAGGPTGRRGSADFTMETGGKEQEVAVKLDDGRRIRGRVVQGENGPGVSGATIRIMRPSRTMTGMDNNNADFDPAEVQTDASGSFTMEGVFPGEQLLSVVKEGLQAKEQVKVTVPSDRDPDPITIVLTEGGSIFGQVLDAEGKPAPGASLQMYLWYPNQTSWEPRAITTDAEGKYRYEALPAGNVQLTVTLPGTELGDTLNFVLAAGEQKEQNFDFSGYVVLTGRITINGKPWSGNELNFYLQTEQRSGQESIQKDTSAPGSYITSVKPDRYALFARRQGNYQEEIKVGEVEVNAEPHEQVKDFELTLAQASVALVFPSDEDFTPGAVLLAKPAESIENLNWQGSRTEASRPHVILHNISPGQYRATFRSNDGEWEGMSEVVDITADGENVIIVDVRAKANKVRVASWNITEGTADPNAPFSTHEVDVTAHITKAGATEVSFDYESGAHATQIESAVLLKNGSEISRDAHLGWSGYTRRDHIYRISVGSHEPGARYTLRYSIRAEGDSKGGVWMQKL